MSSPVNETVPECEPFKGSTVTVSLATKLALSGSMKPADGGTSVCDVGRRSIYATMHVSVGRSRKSPLRTGAALLPEQEALLVPKLGSSFRWTSRPPFLYKAWSACAKSTCFELLFQAVVRM